MVLWRGSISFLLSCKIPEQQVYFSSVYRQLEGILLNFGLKQKIKGENLLPKRHLNISFILISSGWKNGQFLTKPMG